MIMLYKMLSLIPTSSVGCNHRLNKLNHKKCVGHMHDSGRYSQIYAEFSSKINIIQSAKETKICLSNILSETSICTRDKFMSVQQKVDGLVVTVYQPE